MQAPKRGFTQTEFENRVALLQNKMQEHRLDCVFLTSEHHFRYYSGFHSQFWQSPTRPWFLIVPSSSKPIAVVPEIGASALKETWLDEVHTWASPSLLDDGISLLTQVFKEQTRAFHRIGVPMGQEDVIRMPYKNFQTIKENLSFLDFVDSSQILKELLVVKSQEEQDKIKFICHVASQGFSEFPEFSQVGKTQREICQSFKKRLYELGADDCPYMIAASGQEGYDSIITGPTDKKIEEKDLFIVDTGSTYDGYFCDFDRNFYFGSEPSAALKKANEILFEATEAGFNAAKPGNTVFDMWKAMVSVLEKGGASTASVGRLGHGLGMQLTEYPSLYHEERLTLKEGMVLTLEPGMTISAGKEMVHEENILITSEGSEFLSERASPEITCLF